MAVEVILPALGQTTNELTICVWEKREGDRVQKGDVLLTVETDKATVEVPAYTDGVLKGIRYREGETVLVGSVLAWLVKEDDKDNTAFHPEFEREGSASIAARAPASCAAASPSSPAWIPATPRARALAKRSGASLANIRGSGLGGVVKTADVENYLKQANIALQIAGPTDDAAGSVPPLTAPAERSHTSEWTAAPASPPAAQGGKRYPVSRVRRTIADRLSLSKQTIPHYYVTAHVDVTALAELREQLKQLRGHDVSYNSLVIRAVCYALRQYPAVNASLEGAEVVEHGSIGIGFAVEVADGLLVPVVHDADRMNVWELTAALKHLADRARNNQLTAGQITGGTFTVSSLGMFGVDEFAAIINPPEAAILAVGRIADRPVVAGGAVIPGKVLSLTLSVDHRIVDGALAGRFLQAVREELEQPLKLLTPIFSEGDRGPG